MIDLEYICFLNETGYGQAAYDYISALHATNRYNIRINCLNGRPHASFLSSNKRKLFADACSQRKNPHALQVYHCIPSMYRRAARHEHSLGFATYETYDPPRDWIGPLNSHDAVICPSQFNYNIFAHAGIKSPLHHIPHCIDLSVYNNSVQVYKKHDRFTFLFVGTWKKRKGWPQLIEAYLREFDASDSVQLLIKTDKIAVAQQDIEKLRHGLGLIKDFPHILFENRIFDVEQMPCFYKSADCLVMPTLGEGFGLPGLQSMAVGTPVIVTDFSGCQDYANEHNCTLIPTNGFILQTSMDNILQFSNKKWPLITVESVRNALRHAFSAQDDTLHKAKKAYEYVHNNFGYDMIARKFERILERAYSVN